MDLTLTDEQAQLAESATRFLAREWSSVVVRELEAEPGGFRPDLWKRIAGMGWPAMVFGEDSGGLGGTPSDLVVVAERLGRTAATSPLPTSVALAAGPLSRAGDPATAARRRWLPGLVAGDLVGAGALLEPDGRCRWPLAEATRDGSGSGSGWRLTGAKSMVAFAGTANVIVLSTRLAGVGPALVAVASDTAGLTTRRLDVLGGEPYYEVVLDEVLVTPDDVIALGVDSQTVLARAEVELAVYECAWAVGLCEGALALAVGHAKDRTQFGRPIGAFQAVANRLVDIRSDTDALWLLAHRAAWALGVGERDADVHVASMCGYAGWAAATAAAGTHQVMGAIGFTMEHDLQLFTRRLKAFQTRIGPPWSHLDRVADGIGLVRA